MCRWKLRKKESYSLGREVRITRCKNVYKGRNQACFVRLRLVLINAAGLNLAMCLVSVDWIQMRMP